MAVVERPFKEYIDGRPNDSGDTNKSYYGEDCYKFLESIGYDDEIDKVGCVVFDGNDPLIIIGVECNNQFMDYYWICMDINKEVVRKNLLINDNTTLTFE